MNYKSLHKPYYYKIIYLNSKGLKMYSHFVILVPEISLLLRFSPLTSLSYFFLFLLFSLLLLVPKLIHWVHITHGESQRTDDGLDPSTIWSHQMGTFKNNNLGSKSHSPYSNLRYTRDIMNLLYSKPWGVTVIWHVKI